MLVLRRRLAIAGITAVAAIAVPVAALASGSSSPPVKPAPPQAAAPSVTKPVPPGQPAPSSNPVPPAGAAAASKAAAAAGKPDVPAPIQAFAERLGVGTDAAGRAFKEVAGLARNGGADPSSPAFAAIARELGVSPERLAAAWAAVSQGIPGK